MPLSQQLSFSIEETASMPSAIEGLQATVNATKITIKGQV